MKALVLYDSQFGNTEKIARAIGDALSAGAETTLLHADSAAHGAFAGYDVVVAEVNQETLDKGIGKITKLLGKAV